MPAAQKTWWMVALALVSLAAPEPSAAAALAPPPANRQGVHIIRPGDTLERLAETFLGSARRWPEIARMNPEIGDPKHLPPGKRLRIPVDEVSPGAAQIEGLSKRVEERPSPISWGAWGAAQKNDLLIEEDGVRTYSQSSAQMRFGDGTRLDVTEDSLIFLRRSDPHLQKVGRKSVEIVQGQAEVTSQTAPGRPASRGPEIEIVLGNTRATSRPNAAGASQARARRPGEGGAKVMVYGGQGEVEAAGAKVDVAEGMGTSVGKEGPPSPPEKLLAAPRLVNPLAATEMAFSNPIFTWEPVPEAAAYVVELCADPGCGELLDRRVLGTETEWHPEALPARLLYWRATARSRSGLDGYPAVAAKLSILSERPDHEPPAAHLEVSGPRVDVAGRLFTAGGIALGIASEDAGCGILRASPSVDGQPGGSGPWPAGEHHAGGTVLDRCGNRFEVPPLAFTVDTEPPTVRSEITDRAIFKSEGEPKVARTSARRSREPQDTALSWSSDGRRWLYLWHPAEGEKAAIHGEDEIVSGQPQLFLRARGVKLSIDGKTVETGEGQLLWLRAEDAGAGVERLRFRIVQAAGGASNALVLELEAVDLVGNSRKLAWPLVVS